MGDGVDYIAADDLFKEVRILLLRRGISLSAYCVQRGYTRQNLTAALKGTWNGPKARRLVLEVCQDLGAVRK